MLKKCPLKPIGNASKIQKHIFFSELKMLKIEFSFSSRFDETSEHACVSKAFHFGMSFMKPREHYVHEVTQMHLHKHQVATKGRDSPRGVPVGVPTGKSGWTYKAEIDGDSSPSELRRAGSRDLLYPVSTGVPCGGGHWIHGKEDDFDPTLLKDDFPCLICNMGSQFIYTVVSGYNNSPK